MSKLDTPIGSFTYNESENSNEFLGIRYAHCSRFEYATLIDSYSDYDATKMGSSPTQKRAFNEHLDIPERMFYHKEFRENITFDYKEDSLFLNIWAPKEKGSYPVFVFIHGGGFDSGAIKEEPFNGDKLAKRGIVVVTISYRVGPFGYFTHEQIHKKYQHDGNFGLDDQFKAITWVKKNIEYFYGNPSLITLGGQSAGAMSIQYLCCYKNSEGLFQRAFMMSGGGLWPKFSLPRPCEDTRPYWLEVMELAGCKSLEEFKALPADKVFLAVEAQIARSKNNTYNSMPVIDNYYLVDSVDKLMKNPLKIDYMLGFTNNDLFALIMANMALKYAKKMNGYTYFFDVDAKGDSNKAFHSADLRYLFGRFDTSWRPYTQKDEEISNLMMDYVAQYVKTGNPNKDGLPLWTKKKTLHFTDKKEIKMCRPNKLALLKNTFTGDPK